MKATTAYAFVWISTGLAVTAAVWVTKSASPLWALLIPTLISFSGKQED
ncbi:hypothetical protein [Cytobacillus gottheilii]|nr:hypothetical protein [Cytobacillus gottheilii]